MKSNLNLFFATLTAVVVLAGCATAPHHLNYGGLPADKYLIGGGFKVEWRASTDGTFIVADRTTKKILITESVAEGDRAEFAVGEDDDLKTLEKMLGIPIKETNLQAFWIPSRAKSATE